MRTPEARIRLLVIDDHPVFRYGLTALMRTVPWMDVVGEGTTSGEAIDLADRLRPDVVLMDVRLREGSGIEACREIRTRQPHVKVLILSSFADDSVVVSSLLAGASGFVSKDAEASKLIDAIASVARGESLLDPVATQALVGWLRRSEPSDPRDPLGALTSQERNILPLIAEGKMNREIATALNLSEHTVKTYISNVLQKLQMARRSELAAFVTRLRQEL